MLLRPLQKEPMTFTIWAAGTCDVIKPHTHFWKHRQKTRLIEEVMKDRKKWKSQSVAHKTIDFIGSLVEKEKQALAFRQVCGMSLNESTVGPVLVSSYMPWQLLHLTASVSSQCISFPGTTTQRFPVTYYTENTKHNLPRYHVSASTWRKQISTEVFLPTKSCLSDTPTRRGRLITLEIYMQKWFRPG